MRSNAQGKTAEHQSYYRKARMNTSTLNVRTSLHVLAAVLAGAGCAAAQATPRSGLPSGTYEFRICRGTCDPAVDSALAAGTIVIMDRSFSNGALPEPARSYLRFYEEALLVGYAEEEPNACFVVRRRDPGTWLSSPVALTRWNPSLRQPGSFFIALFQSPDAGYWLRLRVEGQDIKGTGYSFGPERNSPRDPHDTVELRHVGPPDLGICTTAATIESRKRPPPRPQQP
jgi:hypothetical protein